jgi:hypothetical protein
MSRRVMHAFIQKYGRLPTEVDPDYLEMLRMSKYQISNVPMYKPGKCANCGSSKDDGREYVDFGLEIDFYGTVFLCGFCIKDVATQLGIFNELVQTILKQEEEIAKLSEIKEKGIELPEKLITAWEEFKDYYVSVHSVRDDPTPGSSVVVEPEPSTDESEVSEQPIIETKPRIVKSAPSTRSKNVRSLADLLDES